MSMATGIGHTSSPLPSNIQHAYLYKQYHLKQIFYMIDLPIDFVPHAHNWDVLFF